MEDETLSISRLAHEHPEVLQVDPISPIYDEISSTESSLILLSLIGVEMVWDGSTAESDTRFFSFRESIDVFEFYFGHI
jgi:hypothetical protein